MNVRPLAFALGLFALAPLAGCARSYIPNTTVEDTSENRKIIGFCEKYRRAVEDRDVEALVGMASPRYFETGGNAKSNDDIDYNGLREYLATRFKQTKAIRYEIKYHRVREAENKVINVDFTYTASFQIPTAQGDLWHRAVRDNRLVLLRDGDSFKIVGGM
ncbi:MAG: nuclear transport factor 2 family protein [Deltaproteobacteria bacterium]|nr:nuclear transport factor 2 family protein [Deltaproteobacteria bacterium]